jgi:hypothetical protein
VLPPPPSGSEPTPFVRQQATPRWPLILSIVGVVAALAVIAVALLPLVGDDDDDDQVSTPPSATTVAGATASTAPGPTEPAAATSTAAAPTTAAPTTAAPTTAAPTTDGPATTDEPATTAAPTTTRPAPTSTAAAGTTVAPATSSTSGPTTTAGPFPDRVAVAQAQATCTAPDSTDSRGNRISFDPLLTIDEVPETAWRCEGAAINEALLLTLVAPSDVTIVGALPGYAGADPFNGTDRFEQNRRVLQARWACLATDGSETATVDQTFADRRDAQYMTVEGFADCAQVLFEILESSRSGGRDYTAVSEIELLGPS